jgi:putative FmdB family regulatory protein
MPTYEYACQSCGTHIEVFQRFSDEPLTECPTCGGPLRKVFHPAGILFKGSGFYRTDSRSGSRAATASKGARSEGDGAKGAGSKVGSSGSSAEAPSSSSGSGEGSGSGSAKASGGSSGKKGAAS